MRNIYTERDSNIRRTWFLFTVFFAVVIGVGWSFGYFYDNPAIFLIAILFSFAVSATSFWFSDSIVLGISRARPASHEENPEFYHIVENLAITAGLATPKIFVIAESAPNAFATGRDPDHAVIAVTEGLIRKLDKQEIEGVISHEIAHIGNRDTLVSTTAVVLVGFVALLSDIFLRAPRWFGKDDDNRELSGLIYLVGLLFAVIAPIAVNLIQLAISRKREFLADASGALLTRYPEGLASALEKISVDPEPLKAASTTNHLWIESPLKQRQGSSVFSTHPPVWERIKRLREMAF